MYKKFKDLDENDNIETISSTLKRDLDEYRQEYEKMKADGVIDEEELNRIITTMQELEFKARTLNANMKSEQEKKIMEEIINLINSEQVNMINIKNTPVQEVQEDNTKEM